QTYYPKNLDRIAEIVRFMGRAHGLLENYAEAEAYLKEAYIQSRTETDKARARRDLGWLRYRQGRLEEAQSLLAESLNRSHAKHEHPSGIAQNLYYLGKVYQAQGNFEQAKSCFQEVLDLFGREPLWWAERCREALSVLGL
ncbi:MAG: tetratricopeptide repeat protein, partial [Nitrospira sp.]|nr:tetratricopeptide repeat protein [Nitrospira sp.]